MAIMSKDIRFGYVQKQLQACLFSTMKTIVTTGYLSHVMTTRYMLTQKTMTLLAVGLLKDGIILFFSLSNISGSWRKILLVSEIFSLYISSEKLVLGVLR